MKCDGREEIHCYPVTCARHLCKPAQPRNLRKLCRRDVNGPALVSSRVFDLRRWDQCCKEWVALRCCIEGRSAILGEFVVLTQWSLLRIRNGLTLPPRGNQIIPLQAAHRRIYGSARQTCYLHHAKAGNAAGVDSLQNHRCRMRELGFNRQRELYLCSTMLDNNYSSVLHRVDNGRRNHA